jgi:hypothetical protein
MRVTEARTLEWNGDFFQILRQFDGYWMTMSGNPNRRFDQRPKGNRLKQIGNLRNFRKVKEENQKWKVIDQEDDFQSWW